MMHRFRVASHWGEDSVQYMAVEIPEDRSQDISNCVQFYLSGRDHRCTARFTMSLAQARRLRTMLRERIINSELNPKTREDDAIDAYMERRTGEWSK